MIFNLARLQIELFQVIHECMRRIAQSALAFD